MRLPALLLLASLALTACAHDGEAPAAMVEPAGCGLPPGDGYALGCANQANLRAMLADPRDLDRGSPPAAARGDAATRPAERYRQGQVQLPATSAPEPTLNVTMEGR